MTSPSRRTHLASASAIGPLPRDTTLTDAQLSSSERDTSEFLTGRGLY
jgi:hypothetical protein